MEYLNILKVQCVPAEPLEYIRHSMMFLEYTTIAHSDFLFNCRDKVIGDVSDFTSKRFA